MGPPESPVSVILVVGLICGNFLYGLHGYMIDRNPNKRAEFLDSEKKYYLEWMVDLERSRITFNVTVETQGWILFGLANDNEESRGKDIVIGGIQSGNGRSYLSDRHVVDGGDEIPVLDDRQDYKLEDAWNRRGKRFLSFSRDLDTCDSEDYPISDNKITIIWAYGDGENYPISLQQRGSYEVYLLEPEYTPKVVRDDAGNPRIVGDPITSENNLLLWTISINITMPTAHTSYLCSIHKAPRLRRKHHIIGFDVYLPNTQSVEHVHHFAVGKCNPPKGSSARKVFEIYAGASPQSCYIPQRPPTTTFGMPVHFCTQLQSVWAIGGRAFFFPPEAGYPLGEDSDEYYMVQVHYDNPKQKSHVEVSVQMDFWYTSRLRPYDAGFMSVGLTTLPLPPTILIPPQSSGRAFGHCGSDCTQRMLPSEGVTIFGAFLHSHNSGVGVRLRHFDMKNEKELPWISYDDNYSNRFQQIRHLREKVKFLPEDQLTMECTYDSRWTNGSVIGGLSTRQEMCVAYFYYYGRIPDYSICRSQIVSEEGRSNFLGGVQNMTYSEDMIDWVATSPRWLFGLTVTEIADRLKWNERLKQDLQTFVESSPQVATCSRDYFARDRQSLITALESSGQAPNISPSIHISSEDDFSGYLGYPFEAKPYIPSGNKRKCQRRFSLGAHFG